MSDIAAENELRKLGKKNSKVAQKKTFDQIFNDTFENYKKTREILNKLQEKAKQLDSEIKKLEFKQDERMKLMERYAREHNFYIYDRL